MQKFGYHSHTTNSDGVNTPQEMVARAEEIGFESYGISDHFNCHPANNRPYPARFMDWKVAREYWKRSADSVREAASQSKIKVLLGFEIDFFQGAQWRCEFEKNMRDLDYDYLIGSTHVIKTPDESKLHTLYGVLEMGAENVPPFMYDSYWQNVKECIKSGYFNFIGHIDLFEKFKLTDRNYEDDKEEVVELLSAHQMPIELNTSGMNKFKDFYPSKEFLVKLNRANIPLIINDDSHSSLELGQHFKEAEELLSEIGYKNRFNLIDRI